MSSAQGRERHVLIVEDEEKLATVLAEYLNLAGYRTDCLVRGDQLMPWLSANQTDLIILDLMLPGRDGMSLCKQIRQHSETPILMATARVDEDDRLHGLLNGADDYVCKPYSMREMVARVSVILRRVKLPAIEQNMLQTPPFLIDNEKMQISVEGELLELTTVEYRLFYHLLWHPEIVFSRDQLLDEIYKDYRLVSTRTIDSHIKNLRKKLQPIFADQELICSVYGVGYKYCPAFSE